jgi:hypothetical protein
LALAVAIAVSFGSRTALAHCDTISGPVITAAKQALETGNVNLVLIWVQPKDEEVMRHAFERARSQRVGGSTAQQSADRKFFETLVRIHRAGEGAPYTGIKPAGAEVAPPVRAADEALATGTSKPVRAALVDAVGSGVEQHFNAVENARKFDVDDVAAGRAYVKAYVQYTHFAERVYDAATASADHHAHALAAPGVPHDGHGSDQAGASHPARSNHIAHLLWVAVAVLGLALTVETGWLLHRRRRSRG